MATDIPTCGASEARPIESLRVAFLLSEFPRLDQTYILSQIEGLLAAGHDVAIYAARPPKSRIDSDAESKFGPLRRSQRPIPNGRLFRTISGLSLVATHIWRTPRPVIQTLDPRRLGRYALSFAVLHAAAPMLHRPRYDVVHCHFGPAGVIGAMLGELEIIRGPLVATFYGHDVTRYPNERGDGVYRRLFNRADLLLALDPVMKQRLEDLGALPDRIAIHPLGVDTTLFSPAETEPPAPPIRLLAVGRFVEKKGFEDALRAMAILRDRERDVVLRLAGAGPLDADLRRLADELGILDRVEFLGHVRHGAIPDLLRDSHALLVPSVRARDGDEEGTPTVIIEAMACGVPVISTRHAGVPFLVEHGRNGLLVDERDSGALADAIVRISDGEERRRLAVAAAEEAVDRFDSARLARCLTDRYLALVTPTPAHRSTGNDEVSRYVILFPGRTGSSWLTSCLAGVSGVTAEGETLVGLDACAQSAWVRSFFEADDSCGCRTIGFKTKLKDIQNIGEFRRLLCEYRPRVVVMYRRNKVKQAVSAIRAKRLWEMTGRWNRRPGDPPLPPFDIPEANLRQELERIRSQDEVLAEFVETVDLPVLTVHYEDLLHDSAAQMQRILQFIDAPQATLRGGTAKNTDDDLSAAVTNFDELRLAFSDTSYADMF